MPIREPFPNPNSNTARNGFRMIEQYFYLKTKPEEIKNINNNLNKERETLLFHAVKKKDMKMVERLLKYPNINVNKGNKVFSPLVKSIQDGSTEIALKLLEHPNADVNRMSRYTRASEVRSGFTSKSTLWYAVNWGRLEIVKKLLEHPDTDINKGDSDGDSPLVEAVHRFLSVRGPEEFVSIKEWRINRGDEEPEQEDPDCDDDNDISLSEYAFDDSSVEPADMIDYFTPEEQLYLKCIELFLADSRVKDKQLLANALCCFEKGILESYKTLKAQDFSGYNYIRDRAHILKKIQKLKHYFKEPEKMSMDEDEFRLLVDNICEFSTGDGDNRNIQSYWSTYIFEGLIHTCRESDYINRGGSAGSQHYFHETWRVLRNLDTPLMNACYANQGERVEELLSNPQIDVNKRNLETGNYALGVACLAGHTDIVRRLLVRDELDVNQINAKNRTPLGIASYEGEEEVVRVLLEDPRIQIFTYIPAMELAVENGKISVLKIFLDKMKETEKKRDWRNRLYKKAKLHALCKACSEGNLEMVELLLKAGAEYNQRSHKGLTPLMCAIENKHYPIVKYLVNLHAVNMDKNWLQKKDSLGETCFDKCLMALDSKIFKELWKHQRLTMKRVEIEQLYKRLFITTNDFKNYAHLFKGNYELPYNAYTYLDVQGIVQREKKTEYTSIDTDIYKKEKQVILGTIREYLDVLMLAFVDKFGRLPDGRKLPELPFEVYHHIGKFMKYADVPLHKKLPPLENPSPEDDLDLDNFAEEQEEQAAVELVLEEDEEIIELLEVMYHGETYYVNEETGEAYQFDDEEEVELVGTATLVNGHYEITLNE